MKQSKYCFLPLLVSLLLSAALRGGTWMGTTSESFVSLEKCGLTGPDIRQPDFSLLKTADFDRDGDIDTVLIYNGERHAQISLFSRQADNSLERTWNKRLSLRKNTSVNDIVSALLTDDDRPDMVIQLSSPPYLLSIEGRGRNLFKHMETPLTSAFPPPLRPERSSQAPRLSLLGMSDWNGDGIQDLLVEHYEEEQGAADRRRMVLVHQISALFCGTAEPRRAETVLNLLALARDTQILAIRDFDGDGSIEVVVLTRQVKGGFATAASILFFRKEPDRFYQVDSWPIPSRKLAAFHETDMNNDAIPDIVLADHENNHFYLLATDKQAGRGFSFLLKQTSLPLTAFSTPAEHSLLFFHDPDFDKSIDMFAVSRIHNQVHFIGTTADNRLAASSQFLPLLPKNEPVQGDQVNWYGKSAWFGDLDGDGSRELCIVTNQPLTDYFTPSSQDPELSQRIGRIYEEASVKKVYAPYFRLLIYRVVKGSLQCTTKLNTEIAARHCQPERILVEDVDMDNKKELYIETRDTRSGRLSAAVYEITGKLP